MLSSSSQMCSSSGRATVRWTDLTHTYIQSSYIRNTYIHTYIPEINHSQNSEHTNTRKVHIYAFIYIIHTYYIHPYIHTFHAHTVEALKESLTMEAMKLTDSENRLKQTELHLQGEMNRVIATYMHTYIHTYILIDCHLV